MPRRIAAVRIHFLSAGPAFDQPVQADAAQDGTPDHRDAQPQDGADAEPGDLARVEE
jgi:hypothetical protein